MVPQLQNHCVIFKFFKIKKTCTHKYRPEKIIVIIAKYFVFFINSGIIGDLQVAGQLGEFVSSKEQTGCLV